MKAWTRDADCIILDLEDSIAPGDKVSARKLVKDAIPIVNKGGADILVRGGVSGAERHDLSKTTVRDAFVPAMPFIHRSLFGAADELLDVAIPRSVRVFDRFGSLTKIS